METDKAVFPDIGPWLNRLLSASATTTEQILLLCHSPSLSLTLAVSAAPTPTPTTLTLTLFLSLDTANINRLRLWSSSSSTVHAALLADLAAAVISYGGGKCATLFTRQMDAPQENSLAVLECVFAALAVCVCVYEAPPHARDWCVDSSLRHLGRHLRVHDAWAAAALCMGADVEAAFMRALCLALANSYSRQRRRPPQPPPSVAYAVAGPSLWKATVHAPVVGPRGVATAEAVIQLRYAVDDHIIRVWLDNVRCHVAPALEEDDEIHFPSKVAFEVGPGEAWTEVLTVTAEESSPNPEFERSTEVGLEAGIDSLRTVTLSLTATEGASMTLRCWRMRQAVHGSRGAFEWTMYDPSSLKEVADSKAPSLLDFMAKPCFLRHRYSSALSPLDADGGVVFSGRDYPAALCWRLRPGWRLRHAAQKEWAWQVSGHVGLTYWPNKHWTSFSETVRHPFRLQVSLQLS